MSLSSCGAGTVTRLGGSAGGTTTGEPTLRGSTKRAGAALFTSARGAGADAQRTENRLMSRVNHLAAFEKLNLAVQDELKALRQVVFGGDPVGGTVVVNAQEALVLAGLAADDLPRRCARRNRRRCRQ